MRRLGDILVEDFGWDRQRIADAVSKQASDEAGGDKPNSATPSHLGYYLRLRSEDRERTEREIEEALARQARENGASQARSARTGPLWSASAAGNDFNETEYLEIGRVLLHERADISRKLRTYGMVLVGLCLFVWYPLSLAVGSELQSQSNGSTLIRLYALAGVGLCLFSLCVGDHVVKSFGAFLKKRMRLAGSRRLIRKAMQDRGLVRTLMPDRACQGPHERSDPDFSKFHTWLPLLYTIFSALKLAVLIFFGGVLITGQATPNRWDLYHMLAVASIAFIAPWIWLTGSMCMRYKKAIREGAEITVDRPFPRVTSAPLRGTNLSRIFAFAHAIWIVVALTGFVCYWLSPQEIRPYTLTAMLFWNLLLFLIRIAEVTLRSRGMTVAEAAAD